MLEVRVCEDLEEGRRLWQQCWPNEILFDFWDVRACFQEAFNHRPYFLVAERDGNIQGLLALSWIEDEQYFGHFPGEIWQGKTWLEQNRIIASDTSVYQALMSHLPDSASIRYLTRESVLPDERMSIIDEIGYLFYPQCYHYSFQIYLEQFSGKSRKKIFRELDQLETLGLSYRYDRIEDIKHLFRMNLEAFKERSYFSDPRFLKSFETLVIWLEKKGLIRVTTVIIGGKIAAVDIGAVLGSTYTIIGGATNSDFPGVAKLINFHHLEWACRQRLEVVDFLCGDFGWKERFRLNPRPLFLLSNHTMDSASTTFSKFSSHNAYA